MNINTMLHRKIKYVLQQPDELCDAVLDVVTEGRTSWNLEDWSALVSHIEASELTVGEYLKNFEGVAQ